MPVLDASFLTRRKWQALIGVVVLIGLYFVFRPERDPAEVIRENLYSWAEQLEKAPEATQDGSAGDVAATASAALLEEFGYTRRLIRSAFTEDARIQGVRGPREQGRDAITKWCLSLRNQATSIALSLSDVEVRFDPATPAEATASLTVRIDATYHGQTYTQTYRCEISLLRDKSDKKWRIDELTAANAPRQTTAPQSLPQAD